MKNRLKVPKGFMTGFLAGAIVVSTATVYAESEMISAYVDNTVKLIIGGQVKSIPEEYKVLNYNGYTYLPSRYVAESLGAQVTWDTASKTITMVAPPEKIVEKIVNVPIEITKPCPESTTSTTSGTSTTTTTTSDSKTYHELQTSQTKEKVKITLIDMNAVGNSKALLPYTALTANVENNTSNNINVDYVEARLISNDVTYKTLDISSQVWDGTLAYSDIQAGDDIDGVFVFPKVDVSQTKYTLKVKARNQDTGKTWEYEIDFKADLDD